jgi:hypothetical protein
MRIAESARDHGVPDEDILHALRHPLRIIEEDDLSMVLGPSRSAELLEIGVLDLSTDPAVVHAMPMRPKYYPYL